MLLLLLLLGLARAAGGDTSWYLIPNAAYDSDDGLGFGLRFEHALLDDALQPYRRAWTVHAFATLRGYHHHRLRFDRLGLGPRGQLRLTAHLAWRQWSNDGYWGIGNGTLRDAADVAVVDGGELDPDDPARRRYRYALYQPFAHVVLRQRVRAGAAWYLYGALNPKLSRVEADAGSLLAEQQPYGMPGGFVPQLLAGAQHDTRVPEVAPRSGHLVELGGRFAPDLDGDQGPWQAGGFAGVLLSARAFQALGSERLVLAGRVMAEVLWGPVPFYEMVHWGGAVPVQGFGGFETLRGVRFGRWRAPGKAVANLELRTLPVRARVGQTALALELAPFADVGTVFLARDQATTADRPRVPLHPAVGVGARLIMDGTFVGRVDLGAGPDPVERADGSVEQQWLVGTYVVFDHPF